LARALAAAARTGETSSLVKAWKAKSPAPPEGNKADAHLGEILRILQALQLGGYQALPRLLSPREYGIEDLVGRRVILELHE